MNERQVEYFRRNCSTGNPILMEDTRDTVRRYERIRTRNIPDVADRASEETDSVA